MGTTKLKKKTWCLLYLDVRIYWFYNLFLFFLEGKHAHKCLFSWNLPGQKTTEIRRINKLFIFLDMKKNKINYYIFINFHKLYFNQKVFLHNKFTTVLNDTLFTLIIVF